MTYWVFATEAAADAAQAVCAAALPHDTVNGEPAPVQITTAWAEVLPTTDGRWGFVACQFVPLPSGGVELTDDEWAALRPAAVTRSSPLDE